MEPERPPSGSTPRLTSTGPQQGSKVDPVGSRGHGPYTQPPRAAKPKRRWLPILVIAAALGAGAVGTHYYTHSLHNLTPTSAVAHAQQTLTLSGADLDEAATAAAVTAIRSGQNDNPLIAKLTEQQKQEIVSGQRKFYKLPVVPAQATQQAPPVSAAQPKAGAESPASHDSAAPTTKPAAHIARHTPRQKPAVPQSQAEQPTPSQATPQDAAAPQDRVLILLDGVVYGTYNITNSPLTLDAPLKMGDIFSLTCLELSPGKSSVTIGVANVLNPVQTTLSLGQSATWTVGIATTAPSYDWFETQARNGNPVAEYGLGHMYQYGIGVTQDTNQAIYWYQQAANQNYLDAKQRLAELGK